MQFTRMIKTFACALSLLAGVAFADAVSMNALANGGAVMRDNQLREIRDVLRGGRGGYVDIGLNYMPLPSQTPLKSQFGEHDGFAFRHHAAAFGTGEISPSKHLGVLLWLERSGWDGEDFFFFPQYNAFAMNRSVTTWGLVYTQSAMDMTVAAGMQHENMEHKGDIYPAEQDSLLYSWAHLRWGKVSVQGNFYKADWRSFRGSLDLESRAVYGGRSSGLSTYLPNIDVALYNGGDDDDSLRVIWEQNLFEQRLYGELAYDITNNDFHSAALKYYPDPSRMIAFEATCLRRNEPNGSKKLLWGGAIDLLFVRIAYNSAYEYEHLFNAKGTVIAELKFSLGTLDGALFGRGAPQSAPMETLRLEKKNKDTPPEGKGLMEKGTDKVLEAKGVRYEKDNGGKR